MCLILYQYINVLHNSMFYRIKLTINNIHITTVQINVWLNDFEYGKNKSNIKNIFSCIKHITIMYANVIIVKNIILVIL